MSAPASLMTRLRRHDVAERFRHFAALLVEHETVGQHRVVGRAAARAAAFQQRGMEPAAMLVRAFEIHHLVGAAVMLRRMPQGREMLRVFQREGVGRAGIEPDVEDVVDLFVIGGVVVGRRGSARRRRLVPGVGAFVRESVDDAGVDLLVDAGCRGRPF